MSSWLKADLLCICVLALENPIINFRCLRSLAKISRHLATLNVQKTWSNLTKRLDFNSEVLGQHVNKIVFIVFADGKQLARSEPGSLGQILRAINENDLNSLGLLVGVYCLRQSNFKKLGAIKNNLRKNKNNLKGYNNCLWRLLK